MKAVNNIKTTYTDEGKSNCIGDPKWSDRAVDIKNLMDLALLHK